MNFLELCRQFIGLDSSPSRGTSPLAGFVASLGREHGLYVELDEGTLNGVDQTNLIIRASPTPMPSEVMLQAHLDTVDPGHFASWSQTQSNPFHATIYDGKIFGLGVAEGKLDFLCKLMAFLSVKEKMKKAPVVLVGTYGALSGMVGAIKLLRRKRITAKTALVGHPTQMNLGYASQGVAIVEISIPFSSEESHYRRQHDWLEATSTQSKIFSGENAITKMLQYLFQLPEGIAIMDLNGGTGHSTTPLSAVLEIDIVGNFQNPIVPKLAHIYSALQVLEKKLKKIYIHEADPFMNIGMIRTYADDIRLVGSCRWTPVTSGADYESWISEIKLECAKVGARLTVNDYKAAFQTPASSSLIKKCLSVSQALNFQSELVEVPVMTEASVFSRFGIECLLVGPGQSVGPVRRPNEFVDLKELDLAVEFYRCFLEEQCL